MRDIIAYIRLNRTRYLLCVISIPLICMGFFSEPFLRYFGAHDPGAYIGSIYNAYFEALFANGWFVPLLYLIAGLPATGNFFDEYHTGISNYHIVRTGTDTYLKRKAILCFFSSAGVLFLGLSIFTVVLLGIGILRGNPLIDTQDTWYLADHPLLLLLIKNLLLAGCGALWNMVALFVSCFVGNRHLILTVPLVIYFVYERVSIFLPIYFDMYSMSYGLPSEELPFPAILIYSFCVFLAGSLILGFFFVKQGRKCVEYERLT